MLGGIADPINPRGCKQHAAIHCGKKILIAEDIADFFPSTTTKVTRNIWQYLFNYTSEVANLLTRLTTYQGCLPQGWKTSGYLANLAFWDKEPSLVQVLEENGFAYSRFMDDVTVSSRSRITNLQKTSVISKVYKMLYSKGYAPKRKKHEIFTRNRAMSVTGITVNSNKPTMHQKQQDKIRAMVHKLELAFSGKRSSPDYEKSWNNVSGHVSHLSRFNKNRGMKYRERLRAIKPK